MAFVLWIEWSHITKMYYPQVEDRPSSQDDLPQFGLLDFSATVYPGITAVLGPEGSGKSTLLRLTAAWMIPDDGKISYGTEYVWSKASAFQDPDPEYLLQKISYVPDTIEILDEIELEESLMMIAYNHQRSQPKKRVKELMLQWGLAGIRDRYLYELEGAELKRFLLAQAFFSEPDILILDEPTYMLDLLGKKLFLEAIQRRPKESITLFATSDMEIAELADVLLLMEQGACRRFGKRKWLTASVPDGKVSSWYYAMQAFTPLRSLEHS